MSIQRRSFLISTLIAGSSARILGGPCGEELPEDGTVEIKRYKSARELLKNATHICATQQFFFTGVEGQDSKGKRIEDLTVVVYGLIGKPQLLLAEQKTVLELASDAKRDRVHGGFHSSAFILFDSTGRSIGAVFRRVGTDGVLLFGPVKRVSQYLFQADNNVEKKWAFFGLSLDAMKMLGEMRQNAEDERWRGGPKKYH